jgi:hypothetical protein
MRFLALLLLLANLPSAAAPASGGLAPEAAYISAQKYTNAALGFSVQLPLQESHRIGLKIDGNNHFLFGLMFEKQVLTTFVITARATEQANEQTAKHDLEMKRLRNLKQIAIGGRIFWKGESESKDKAGKMRSIEYTAAMDGYIVDFSIISFEQKLAAELANAVESMVFIDPAKAKEIAGANAFLYPEGPTAPPELPEWKLESGTVTGNVYANSDLGLEFQFPDRWVAADHSTVEKVLEAGHQEVYGGDANAAKEHKLATQCVRDLLYVTKDPVGEGNKPDLNPMIMVMALNPVCGKIDFPKSLDDREAIRRIADQVVEQISLAPAVKASDQKTRAFVVQGHVMIEITGDSKLTVSGRSEPVPAKLSLLMTKLGDALIIWETAAYSPEQWQEARNVKIAMHK